MICYRDLTAAAGEAAAGPPRAAAIGFFDGLHAGHRRLLEELRSWALERGAEPAVVTFDRHPQEVLRGRGPPRILSLRHRLVLLAREGVAAALVLSFDREMATWSPEEFVERVCRRGLGARHLLFGFDSAFGRDRRGTFAYVSGFAPQAGLEVRQASPVRAGDERVSSTLVREALVAGDLSRLRDLLGRDYAVLGRVVRGDGRGKALGFPTANLDLEGASTPPGGVYFAEARVLGREGSEPAPLERRRVEIPAEAGAGPSFGAVANLGVRPTFQRGVPAGTAASLEVHLLGAEGDLYGSFVEVSFLERHRPELRFGDPESLKAQIRADLEAYRAFRARRAASDAVSRKDT